MTLKSLLILFIVPVVLARNQAALICENGGILTQTRSDDIVPCYTPSSGGAYCSFHRTHICSYDAHWDSHVDTTVTRIYCDDPENVFKTALCYRVNNGLDVSNLCFAGYEAVATIVSDGQFRRLGEPTINFENKETKEVEINGEKWVLVNPNFHEEE